MFSLVDPARTRISGMCDTVGEASTADLAAATDFSLDKPNADIQSWVVVNKRPCVVPDWQTWGPSAGMPEVQRELCRQAGHGPFAVVPMFIRKPTPEKPSNEEVFGTIHVERQDGLPPSGEDVDDLIEFGRQMAAAANQSERLDVLLRTLHCDQDSLVILDHEQNIRFVNEVASARLQLDKGWHDTQKHLRLTQAQHKDFFNDIAAVVSTGKRNATDEPAANWIHPARADQSVLHGGHIGNAGTGQRRFFKPGISFHDHAGRESSSNQERGQFICGFGEKMCRSGNRVRCSQGCIRTTNQD